MRVEIADDKAAAVKIDEHGKRFTAGGDRRVAAHAEFAAGTWCVEILDLPNRYRSIAGLRERFVFGAGFLRRLFPDRITREFGHPVEERTYDGIERHRDSNCAV